MKTEQISTSEHRCFFSLNGVVSLRRRKNNIASRRSRETRKQKFVGMEKQAEELEAKNAALRVKVAELERLTKIMKDALVQQLAGAGKAAAQACAQSGAL